jgi:large subunit ribosomal protein L21
MNNNLDKYAVIKVGGEQYRVAEGDEIDVFRLPDKENSKLFFEQVLLVKDTGGIKVGRPVVEGAKVEAKVEKHFRGDKIRVATYKAKSRYRKVKGHRDELTRIRIGKVS